MCEKFAHTRFEPTGWSDNQDIGYAKSIMDYIFRWLQMRFLTGQQQALFDGLRPRHANGVAPVPGDEGYVQKPFGDFTESAPVVSDNRQPATDNSRAAGATHHASDALKDLIDLGDAPTCHVCGAIMTRNGSCYRCMSCGSTSGCS